MSIRNEPDKNILKYWKPQIDLNEGIIDIIKQMKMSKKVLVAGFFDLLHSGHIRLRRSP